MAIWVLSTGIDNGYMYVQVIDNSSAALAISLPFSCILGLLASMTSSTMGMNHLTNLHRSDSFTVAYLRNHPISTIGLCSNREIYLGLCNISVRPSGCFCTYFLLIGKLKKPFMLMSPLQCLRSCINISASKSTDSHASHNVSYPCHIFWFRHHHEWEFRDRWVPEMEDKMESQSPQFRRFAYISQTSGANYFENPWI